MKAARLFVKKTESALVQETEPALVQETEPTFAQETEPTLCAEIYPALYAEIDPALWAEDRPAGPYVESLVNPSKTAGPCRGSLGVPDWRTAHRAMYTSQVPVQ
jgi:hypothetical protein